METNASGSRKTTASSLPKAGKSSAISESGISLLSPVFTHLKKPAPNGRRKALTKASFKAIFIDSGLTQEQAMKRAGVSYQVLVTSRHLYGEEFKEALRRRRSKNHSRAMRGNKHGGGVERKGKKHKIKKLLPEKKLRALIAKGLNDELIAKRLGTTLHHVRRNVEYYEIERQPQLPLRLQHMDEPQLARLESLVPGFKQAAALAYEEPHQFFLHLYQAFARMRFLLEDIRSLHTSHKYYVQTGKVPKDHITFSMNMAELALSMALLDAGVPHQRLRAFHKNYQADFAFPPTRLLVEVDGEFHDKDETTIKRDARKEEKARELGYEVRRFGTAEVLTDTAKVVATIERWLASPVFAR